MQSNTGVVAILAFVLGAAPVLAAPFGGTGSVLPSAGTVDPGETHTSTYDNNPTGSPCIAITSPYTVTIAKDPSSTVILSAGGYSTTVNGATGSLSFTKGVCAHFDVSVTGVSGSATFVTAVRGGLSAASPPCCILR